MASHARGGDSEGSRNIKRHRRKRQFSHAECRPQEIVGREEQNLAGLCGRTDGVVCLSAPGEQRQVDLARAAQLVCKLLHTGP